MEMFRKFNSLLGWFTFLVAAVLYLVTMEPTASLWDCGEFIAASYKLQVGHPPGAPFFLIVGRIFTLFAGDPSRVAAMVNAMSALCSAFTILLLFWTITHLAKRMYNDEEGMTKGRMIIVLMSGLVGSLAYAFSDTFWFSAVEGEVYAMSSLFTALVFWLILKWEERADEPFSNRRIILIAYLMGLSIGVHLLNLLAIPAIAFVYYFRKYTPTRRGFILALLISFLILGFMYLLFVPGFIQLASLFELLFVNTFGFPYHTGILFYLLLTIGLVSFGLFYTHKRGKVVLNTVFLGLTALMIGYSSYTMIIIRSSANPPMDQNNPQNVFSLLKYINREQYQSTPLLKGPYYNAPVTGVRTGKPTYVKENGKYVVATRDPVYEYDPRFVTIFPRIWSRNEDQHIRAYQMWGKIKGQRITVRGYSGENEIIVKPTFGENLRFFVRYQLGHMYFRYFMWNFSGRQNDIQGHGSVLEGNWISGIPFIDNPRLGPQENLPEIYRNNPARNRYYLLPLLLGIMGITLQFRKDARDFWVILLLFLMTGIAIVVYLNQWPYQPRERDYAYAGSFYAFAIWIGMGAACLYTLFKKALADVPSAVLAGGLSMLVPVIMLAENYDDHNRAGRYTARDFGANYLNSCEENAVLFTNGDNDTFPLWYVQDVEGIRTDLRVTNLSYLGASWYIEQMKAKAYLSSPLPFSLREEQFRQGTRDIILVRSDDRIKGPQNIRDVMQFIASDDPRTRVQSPFMRGEQLDFSPTKLLRIPVDTLSVIENGTVRNELASLVKPYIDWELPKDILYKNDLMIIDLMATNNWERPVYFAVTVPRSAFLGLDPFLQLEGMAYRVVPIGTGSERPDLGRTETSVMYRNVMDKFRWGGIQNPKVYLDENNLRMLSNIRYNFNRLAAALIEEGKSDSAMAVMGKSMELFPHPRVPYNYFSLATAENFYLLGQTERADAMVMEMFDMFEEEISYILSLERKLRATVLEILQLNMHIAEQLTMIYSRNLEKGFENELYSRFERLVSRYNSIR